MAHIFSPAKPQLLPIPTPSQVLTPEQPIQGGGMPRTSQTPSFLGSAVLPPAGAQAGAQKKLLGA